VNNDPATTPTPPTPQDVSNAAVPGGTAPAHDDYQNMYKTSGKFKEQLESIAQQGGKIEEREAVRGSGPERQIDAMEEIPTQPELEKKPDLDGYIEKVEKEAELTRPVLDDYTQQILLKPTSPQNPTVTLPLTEAQVTEGLHHQVWESVRWLAEWCVRQVKLLHGKAIYRPEVVPPEA